MTSYQNVTHVNLIRYLCDSGKSITKHCWVSGIREAEINVAEGKKQSRILSSEAYQLEQINQARGAC